MNRPSRLHCLAWLAAACLAAGASPLAAQPAFRVADLNTDEPRGPGPGFQADDMVELSGSVYFAAVDGIHGSELWRVDGAGATAPEVAADVCPGICSSRPIWLTAVGSALFFAADDGHFGRELWVSDAGGTRLVADLLQGAAGAHPNDSAALGDKLLFSATDPVHGNELWVSDGTATGTRMLLDIRPGDRPSLPAPLGVIGSRLLFAANDGVHGNELWATDGTAEGTVMVAEICPGPSGSLHLAVATPGDPIAEVAGDLLFVVADDCTHGPELWVSDGTAANTRMVEDIFPGSGSSAPDGLTRLGSRILFSALEVTHGVELWVSDGTAEGTHVLADVRPGAAGSGPQELTVSGGEVYFHADDGVRGRELWASDGTAAGTRLVAEVQPGIGSSMTIHELHGLTALDSRLVFFPDDGMHGREPWASDGTAAGTVPLGDLRPGLPSSFPGSDLPPLGHRAVVGDRLFFRGFDDSGEPEIWSTDGTAAGTSTVGYPGILTSSFDVLDSGRLGTVRPFADLGGSLLFPATDSHGHGPWASDGTAAGTVRLTDPFETPEPQEITVLGDIALFVDRISGRLHRTDGTPAGTFHISNTAQSPSGLTLLGDRVLFSDGGRLWASDGTGPGTAPFAFQDEPGNPAGLAPFPAAGRVLFRATDPSSGDELWSTDGTDAGTQQVADALPGPAGSLPASIVAAGPLAFFAAELPATGRELWATDGTAAGSRLVADTRPGTIGGLRVPLNPPGVDIERFAAAGTTVFFAAHRLVTGEELWKSDGTTAGTMMVRDIFPGPGSAEIRWLTSAGAGGSRVYFVADDGEHGRELWTSDGTEEGTRMVEDIVPGEGSGYPAELALVDGLLLFSARDGEHGVEPWKSNGTAAGTFRIEDIAPGALPSTPLAFTPAGPNLYFAANDGETGFELWALPRAALSRFADVPPGHWAWPFVEALAAAGLTSGCGNGNFCPGAQVSRAQMAVFLVSAVHGPGFTPPPATGTRFTDVPAGAFAAAHIEQLASDGVTGGCSQTPPRYCPASLVSRAQMAVFLLVAKHGAGFTPPAGTGAVFSDVGPTHWARDWIEQLAAEGITGGCGGGNFCPDQLVTRAEMAVLLTTAFELLP